MSRDGIVVPSSHREPNGETIKRLSQSTKHRIEFHLVARMVAPAADAKLSLDRAAKAFGL